MCKLYHLHGWLVVRFEGTLVCKRIQQTCFAHTSIANDYQMLRGICHRIRRMKVNALILLYSIGLRRREMSYKMLYDKFYELHSPNIISLETLYSQNRSYNNQIRVVKHRTI